MIDDYYHFHDLFDQLGLPSTKDDIAAFLVKHSPLSGDILIADAAFWDAGQAQFLREKKATDDPQWAVLIDQLSEALRNDPQPEGRQAKPRLLGISGSLRSGSFNTMLLHAAQTALGNTATLDIATLHGIPLYDGDVEAKDGLPSTVIALRQRIHQADGIIIATPEYNGGVPGVLKNALDWVSRVSAQHPDVLKGKPVAIMGASPSGFGTISAQINWLSILWALGMQDWSGKRLMISKAHTVVQNNALTDTTLAQQLADFVQEFSHFTAQQTVQQ